MVFTSRPWFNVAWACVRFCVQLCMNWYSQPWCVRVSNMTLYLHFNIWWVEFYIHYCLCYKVLYQNVSDVSCPTTNIALTWQMFNVVHPERVTRRRQCVSKHKPAARAWKLPTVRRTVTSHTLNVVASKSLHLRISDWPEHLHRQTLLPVKVCGQQREVS